MKPPSIVIDHFLSTKWSKKLFTINHYELQNGKCIVTQELSAYDFMIGNDNFPNMKFDEVNYIGEYLDRCCRLFLFGQIKKWPDAIFLCLRCMWI